MDIEEMVRSASFVKKWEPDTESSDGRTYAGNLMESKDSTSFFHRKVKRYDDVIAGFSDGYCFAIQDSILSDLLREGIDIIIIETEFNIFEISLEIFTVNSIQHPAINFLSLCPEEHFSRTRKSQLDEKFVKRHEEKEKKEEAKQKEEEQKPKSKSKPKYGEQSSLF